MSVTAWACRFKPPLYRLSLRKSSNKNHATLFWVRLSSESNTTRLHKTQQKKILFRFLREGKTLKKKKKLEPTNVDSLHLRKWRQIAALPAMHAKPVLINQPMLKVQNCFLFDEESTVATLILCHLHVDYPLIFLTLELVD